MEDYSKIGLKENLHSHSFENIQMKAGLEIHQQLDTKKLFCDCPSVLRNDEHNLTLIRKLHAVAGESGEVDEAAAYHAALGKEFIYQCYDENTCLVDMDEEPPHEINKEALEIALKIATLLNCKILQTTQIMRKTVVDGSNTSGFQRTVLLAVDGFVETERGKVGIQTIGLEEDAARIIVKGEDQIIYRLDRLGIPLVEIATSPDIKSPEQAKEVALHIGDILRACKVKRGIGTIRQDVNMSIKGGNRVEIKGFQDIRSIQNVMEKEIERQSKLLKEGKKVVNEVRQALPNGETEFLRPMPGAARMYPETDLPLLKISREKIDEAKKNLPKLKAEHEEELRKTGLSKEMMKLVLDERKVEEFKELHQIVKIPDLIVKMLLIFPKEISSHEKIPMEQIEEKLNADSFSFILESLKKGKIAEEQIKEVLRRISHGIQPEKAIIFEKKDVNEVEEFVIGLLKEKPGLSENAYMGLVMQKFKGKVSGKEIIEIIKKYVK